MAADDVHYLSCASFGTYDGESWVVPCAQPEEPVVLVTRRIACAPCLRLSEYCADCVFPTTPIIHVHVYRYVADDVDHLSCCAGTRNDNMINRMDVYFAYYHWLGCVACWY